MKNPFIDQQIEEEVLEAPWRSAIKYKPGVILFMKTPTAEQIAYAVRQGLSKKEFKSIPISHLNPDELEYLQLLGIVK